MERALREWLAEEGKIPLSLEGEAGADLVGGLVEVLGVEGSTQAEGHTRAQENVVAESGDTTVVDLGLL